MGRTKLIETPEKLMEIFEEYRAYTPATVSYTHLTLPTILLV